MISAQENPFSADRIAQLPFRIEGTWEDLLARLEKHGWRGSIVGSHGSGKTSLLTQLIPHLEARGFVPHLIELQTASNAAQKDAILARVKDLRAPGFLLIDGAEQLTTRQWLPLRVAIDALAGCVVTVHRTSRLPTLVELSTTPRLLEDLVEELTGGHLPAGEAAAIHARHGGNLRRCFDELATRFAG